MFLYFESFGKLILETSFCTGFFSGWVGWYVKLLEILPQIPTTSCLESQSSTTLSLKIDRFSNASKIKPIPSHGYFAIDVSLVTQFKVMQDKFKI